MKLKQPIKNRHLHNYITKSDIWVVIRINDDACIVSLSFWLLLYMLDVHFLSILCFLDLPNQNGGSVRSRSRSALNSQSSSASEYVNCWLSCSFVEGGCSVTADAALHCPSPDKPWLISAMSISSISTNNYSGIPRHTQHIYDLLCSYYGNSGLQLHCKNVVNMPVSLFDHCSTCLF